MSKVNNLLNLIFKSSLENSTTWVEMLFSSYETELINLVKDMKVYLSNSEEQHPYGVGYIASVLTKLSEAIYYYNDGIDGVFVKRTPIIDEAVSTINNTAKEARDLWTKIVEKN